MNHIENLIIENLNHFYDKSNIKNYLNSKNDIFIDRLLNICIENNDDENVYEIIKNKNIYKSNVFLWSIKNKILNIYKYMLPNIKKSEKYISSILKTFDLELIQLFFNENKNIKIDENFLTDFIIKEEFDILYYLIPFCNKIENLIKFICSYNRVELLYYLINNDYDIHYDNEYILRYACETGNIDLLQSISKKKCNLSINVNYCMRIACIKGYLDILKFLTKLGCDIRFNDDYLLILATENNHNDIVAYLLDSGLNAKCYNNECLFISCINNNTELVELFIKHDVDIVTNFDFLFEQCVKNNNLKIIKLLIDNNFEYSLSNTLCVNTIIKHKLYEYYNESDTFLYNMFIYLINNDMDYKIISKYNFDYTYNHNGLLIISLLLKNRELAKFLIQNNNNIDLLKKDIIEQNSYINDDDLIFVDEIINKNSEYKKIQDLKNIIDEFKNELVINNFELQNIKFFTK